MPDFPGAHGPNRCVPSLSYISIPKRQKASVLIKNQMRRLETVKEQLQDMQTQIATLVGVVDGVMDQLYDTQVLYETEIEVNLSEDK